MNESQRAGSVSSRNEINVVFNSSFYRFTSRPAVVSAICFPSARSCVCCYGLDAWLGFSVARGLRKAKADGKSEAGNGTVFTNLF